MDIKVFVDADADDRLIRVINRDCIERGRTPGMVVERYERVLKPMHNMYIEPAKRFADHYSARWKQYGRNQTSKGVY